MNKSMSTPESHLSPTPCEVEERKRGSPSIAKDSRRPAGRLFVFAVAISLFLIQPTPAKPQALSTSSDSSIDTAPTAVVSVNLRYDRPTQRTITNNYLFDAFGPYPIAGSAIAAGINQYGNSPPEWNQGVKGYSRRLGSDFGTLAVGTTTRYALSEALREDSMYYRCDCTGALPRLRHAVFSTLTARRGNDGHLVFSIPALVAPYVGTMTAVYGWYPNRFGAKDAFRMGNYAMLTYIAGNISLEFFYDGPHSLLRRMHLNNTHGSPVQGPNK